MPQRQLNIRSDEAFGRASAIARRLGRTTTEVVNEALRIYEATIEPRDELGLSVGQREDYDSLLALARETSTRRLPGMTSDHDWLYDEFGLPK